MNRFLLVLAFSLILLGIPNVHARNSAASYDNKYWSQQEFVQAYNNTTGPMYRDYVVGLDTSPGINPNNNLGQYVVEATTSTTDNIYVFGVVDETIPAGQLGRIAIRGPHKVVAKNLTSALTSTYYAAGAVLSQCASNVNLGLPVSSSVNGGLPVNGGIACPYSTATGTAGGTLGYIISATATTDTGDQTSSNEYWAWINPQVLR